MSLVAVLTTWNIRILLAGIRNLGTCSCPRCLVHKDKIGDLGTSKDQQRRETQLRKDSHEQRVDIARARMFSYESGMPVNDKGVDGLLKSQSLVPTIVCSYHHICHVNTDHPLIPCWYRMHSLLAWVHWD